jgi:general secretion pathway protein C
MASKLGTCFRVVKLVGFAAVLQLSGSAAARALAVPLLDVEPTEAPIGDPPPLPAVSAAPPSRPQVELGDFNPFCPHCVPKTDAPSKPVEPSDPRVLFPAEAESDRPLELVATMESDAGSLAVVRHETSSVVGIFAAGELVDEGARLHAVGRGIVHLQADGGIEYLALRKPGKRKPKPTVRKASSTTKRKLRPWEVEGADDAISCTGNHCRIDREFVERMLAKPSVLAKQARVVPYRKDGETIGYKIYGIRPNSLPWLLGLRSGDLVQAVNDHALDSLDNAMRLYRELRRARHLEIELQRRGKPVKRSFDIP